MSSASYVVSRLRVVAAFVPHEYARNEPSRAERSAAPRAARYARSSRAGPRASVRRVPRPAPPCPTRRRWSSRWRSSSRWCARAAACGTRPTASTASGTTSASPGWRSQTPRTRPVRHTPTLVYVQSARRSAIARLMSENEIGGKQLLFILSFVIYSLYQIESRANK